MGKVYKVPPNMKIKEKVIGGVLTLPQGAWLGAGLVLGLVVFALLFGMMGKLALFFGFLISLSGVPFAFYKKEQLSLFEYLRLKKIFDKKSKELPNKRKVV